MAYTAREVSVEESFSNDTQQVVRVFHVDPWTSRGEFLAAVAGGVRTIGDMMFRQLPSRDPDYPWLYANDVKFKPLGEDPGTLSSGVNHLLNRASYTTALATVTYGPLDNEGDQSSGDGSERPQQGEQQEIDLATINWDFTARSLKLPNHWFQWEGDVAGTDGVVANSDTAVVKVFPGIQLVVTRHLVARKPHEAILGMLGRINASDFWLQGDKYPKNTLRFDSAKVSRKYTNRGVKYFEITYNFGVQPTYGRVLADKNDPKANQFVGWNRLYDPRKGYWRFVKALVVDGTQRIYELDEDGPTQTFGGTVKKGFQLLFDPRAK